MVGPRRRSREVALQVLYGMDGSPELGADDALALFVQYLDDEAGGDGERPGEYARALCETLVRGVAARRAELDEIIGRISTNWRLERMARVDRNVLRLALYELRHCEEIPVRVTMNEAVELAKRYGAAEAGAFVNGLLERAVAELGISKAG